MMLAVLVVIGFMAGWFSIERDGDQTKIEINRDEIRQDAQQAVDRGREYLEQRGQQAGQAASNAGYPENTAAPANAPWGNYNAPASHNANYPPAQNGQAPQNFPPQNGTQAFPANYPQQPNYTQQPQQPQQNNPPWQNQPAGYQTQNGAPWTPQPYPNQ